MGSFQYKFDSLRAKPPLTFLLLTRTMTSPATQSGLSSASPSKTTSAPSGMPRSTCRLSSDVVSTMRWPLHVEHRCLIDLPRPEHRSQCICICWKMPGPSWCRTRRTPRPSQVGQVTMSFSLRAPVPVARARQRRPREQLRESRGTHRRTARRRPCARPRTACARERRVSSRSTRTRESDEEGDAL